MPEPYSVGAIFRVVLYGTLNVTIPLTSTFQFILSAATGTLSFQNVKDDMLEVMDSVAADMTNDVSELVTYFTYTVNELDDTVVSGQLALTAPATGDIAVATSQPLPFQTQLVLNFPTGYSKRRLLKYIPGLTEADTDDDGLFLSTTRSAWAAVGNGWRTTFEQTNGAWRYMYQSPNELLVPAQVYPQSCSVSNVPKVLRSRRS